MCVNANGSFNRWTHTAETFSMRHARTATTERMQSSLESQCSFPHNARYIDMLRTVRAQFFLLIPYEMNLPA